MANMSDKTRACIIQVAKDNGFLIELDAEGHDLYDKNLVFRSRALRHRLYIHRTTGISPTSGDFSYLKVAVHPNEFRSELACARSGIFEYLNKQSNANRHHSSNYRDYPKGIPGKSEPYGTCYKVTTLPALGLLMAGLSRSQAHQGAHHR